MTQSNAYIALYLPSLRGGGAERMAVRLAQGLSKRGAKVDLVLVRAEGPYLQDVPNSVRVVDLKSKRVFTSIPGLVRYLQKERPYALLSFMTHANIAAIWARKLAGKPSRLIVSQRNVLSWTVKGNQKRMAKFFPLLVRNFYPLSDGVIAVSSYVANDLKRFIRPSVPIKTIYNPVLAPEIFQQAEQRVTHPWFNPKSVPIILGVGRLTKQKGFDLLLRAFSIVRNQYKTRLLILGEGEMRAELESLARELKIHEYVDMPGFVTNPYTYMRHSDIFVLSSRWEGLPGVLIESLSLRVPIVATDCPGGVREILDNGKWGKLVPCEQIQGLADGILNLLEKKERGIDYYKDREHELDRFLERFTPQRVIEEYEKVLLG